MSKINIGDIVMVETKPGFTYSWGTPFIGEVTEVLKMGAVVALIDGNQKGIHESDLERVSPFGEVTGWTVGKRHSKITILEAA